MLLRRMLLHCFQHRTQRLIHSTAIFVPKYMIQIAQHFLQQLLLIVHTNVSCDQYLILVRITRYLY